MKDDSGAYAVFTEQGSSASQMTAAKVMDVIARLPDCDGQVAGAISAYTQEKWRMHKNYVKFPNQNVRPLERNLYGHPLVEHSTWRRLTCTCIHAHNRVRVGSKPTHIHKKTKR